MKKSLIALAAAALTLSITFAVFARDARDNDQGKNEAKHFGPFAGSSPDSGTCGNNWANDTFQRHFIISKTNKDVLTEFFKEGKFVTVAGASPGGCDTNPGGTVSAGVRGEFEGSFVITVSSGTYNPDAVCTQSSCNTTPGFIARVYGSGATFNIPTFEFHYDAGPNGKWRNASADRGGNLGDITGNPKPKNEDRH